MTDYSSNIAIIPLQQTHTDAELVKRSLNGAGWAEEMLYRRYVDRVTAFCLRSLRHRTDTEDVVQDTFVQAFTRLSTLREPDKFHTWLMQIAFSRMHRLFRRQKLSFVFFQNSHAVDTPLAAQTKTDAPQEHRMELSLLDNAFDLMSHKERICWILRYLEERTVGEIAEITGMSGTSVKRRLAGAATIVKRHLGEDAHD